MDGCDTGALVVVWEGSDCGGEASVFAARGNSDNGHDKDGTLTASNAQPSVSSSSSSLSLMIVSQTR